MSDDSDNQKGSKIALGKELAKIRLEKKLSIKEIAREIRVDSSIIKKIEKNDFESMGAPVFVKGYLRQYAVFIGMDADKVLERYNQLNPKEDIPPVINDSVQQLSKFIITPKIIIFSILSIVIATILWFLFSYFVSQDDGFESNVITNNILLDFAQESSSLTETMEIEPVLNESQDLIESTIVTDNQESSSLTETMEIEPVIIEKTPSIVLTMNYRGLCWTEVYDANDNQIFYGLGGPDNNVNITGVGPLDVMLGAADELIGIYVDEQEYTIVDPVRRGEVLRFQVEGP
mgnify:CR=1 FL=1